MCYPRSTTSEKNRGGVGGAAAKGEKTIPRKQLWPEKSRLDRERLDAFWQAFGGRKKKGEGPQKLGVKSGETKRSCVPPCRSSKAIGQKRGKKRSKGGGEKRKPK